MAVSAVLRLVPDAPAEVGDILDPARGPLENPNRSEIFGPERFAQHGRSLAETHAAGFARRRTSAFFPRLLDNIRTLREAQHYIASHATAGYEVSPAAEWLLDNFHLIEAQAREIKDGLPRRYFRDLPVLKDEPLVGLPRVYGVAWAFVAHTDSAFDDALLVHFLHAYEEVRELTLGELWALPTTLRVVLMENLRRLAERAAANKAARELANLCCDRIEAFSPEQLDAVLALLNQRGVGESFLGQMAQQLQDHRTPENGRFFEWLGRVAPHLAEIQTRLPAAQAADNLSVSNAITSLRSISDADWPDIVAATSVLTREMLTSPAFAAERDDTRDQTLHAIEKLARKSGHSEREVARTLLGLMRGAESSPDSGDVDARTVANHWLRGSGRGELRRALGLADQRSLVWGRRARRAALPAYLGAIGTLSAALVLWMLWRHSPIVPPGSAPPWLAVFAALLMIFPASEAVVAIVNRLISESVRPVRLPRLGLAGGIPAEHRTMVAIPAMLASPASGSELAHDLELHYLANPERHAQFALVTDWPDADGASDPGDVELLHGAAAEVERLNALYPAADDEPARFIVLHRARRLSPSEERWIGWERKRGKLEQLIALLAEGGPSPFFDLGRTSTVAAGTRYVVTLDSDTRLPPGRLRELVGVAAHPHNQPRLSADGRRVERGYAILQPHVATPLPEPHKVTLYHWLFAGQPGIDPYSATSSEVYQDVFGEGTYAGKGLLHVHALHAVLGGRLPENRILSHDLLEGSLARCAAVTDISVIEDAPFHADVAASRVHRWTRGDWQLLPFVGNAKRWPMRAINRWKMIDNLRRSLVAPASLALLAFALATGGVSPWASFLLVAFAFSGGPLMGALAGLAPVRDDIARLHFYRQGFADLGRALASAAWQLAQLLQLALMASDAIVRALYRQFVSQRDLLEWRTAAAAEAEATTDLAMLVRAHWVAPVTAAALCLALLAGGTVHRVATCFLCLVWGLSPVSTWWVSRPRRGERGGALSSDDRSLLHDVARDTWRLFERLVGAEDHHLPPDNLQVVPSDMVAHRTSPTNVGLYLLATACAQRFGWIGTVETIERIEATLATLATLPRHRGHFFNWYDSTSSQALTPLYVSTVDSGNLCTHLLALAQACLALSRSPLDTASLRRALAASSTRLSRLRTSTGAAPLGGVALAEVLADAAPLERMSDDRARYAALLSSAATELTDSMPSGGDESMPSPMARLAWAAEDHLSTLRSALRDLTGGVDAAAAAERLRAIATRCRTIAAEPDFAFLFHRKRRLFHIGYRVAEHQLDGGFYDLLASEARATSLWAIAKGDVPAAHWAALGRPFYAVGELAGLRSWSGSMFEYLMPTLVLDEPYGSVLHSAAHAAVLEQIAFAHEHHVPWGISECAYAASDHTLAYQYAPQGVPRLALRRTPDDELVVAPYATALATQVMPHRAASNLRRLERARARGRYGFIESLDYSPARQSGAEGVARVSTFMAHHQGMSIVAVANVLLDGVARTWGMGDARIEAVASLLHERAPREVPPLREPPTGLTTSLLRKRSPGMFREVTPGMAAIEPTHLLSNGRYAVALRANGAGSSRRGPVAVTRTRDDPLRDAHGWFFHARWDRQPRPVSLTQHPAPDPAAHYHCSLHADRVAFTAVWPELEATTTVWVSPEDDIEFRRVVLQNRGERTLDIELLSSFEVALADPRADESHPAFSNLFVSAEWQARYQAIVLARKPRLATDRGLLVANFLATVEPANIGVRIQVDRQRWLGRNREASHPLAAFDEPPTAGAGDAAALDTGLDPVAAFALRLQIAPNASASATFCTATADDPATLRAVMDKYRQAGNIDRASLMSATLTGIRLREMRINAENFAAIQTLSTMLALSLARTHLRAADAAEVCDRRLLWRFGISGDLPIVLVSAGVAQGLGLLRSLAQALRLWSWGGVACDLVVVNHEPASYLMPLNRSIAALKEAHAAALAAQPGSADTGFHLLQSSDLHADEISTLRSLARARLNADGRPLAHHMQELADLHERSFQERQGISVVPLGGEMSGATSEATRPSGDFAPVGGEFRFDVSARSRPARPWVNVLANPAFGAQISEAGGGYTWAVNSRLNMLTPWSNDPVGDPAGEWFLLQDMRSLQTWSVTPSAAGDAESEYRIAHGQGYSAISHRHGSLDTSVTWCVDSETAVKQVRVRLVNRGHRTMHLRLIGVAEWILGAQRSDRATTHASSASVRAAPVGDDVEPGVEQVESRATVLLCTQRDRSAGFGSGTAFLALAGPADDAADWTCDRRELFDSRGRAIVADHYAQASGCGLDPCAVLSIRLAVRAGDSIDRVFLLGYGADPAAALAVAEQAALVPPLQRLQRVRARWDELLGAIAVRTPDPLFDALVNRWLLYQTIACRLWARAGFYQAGGAYGFRDQLQDAMALAWAAPALLRQQIVLAASRQFAAGDVQHWWHAPTGAGVRTHFSDDLLWLPHACAHYVAVSGDIGVLDERVPFLEGAQIPAGAEDAYYTPAASDEVATVYEHGARAIDRSLAVGVHGLPLMGSGDWNDGMNRVGHEGRGESVWLAWLLCDLVGRYAPIAEQRGELERAARWRRAERGWRDALQASAWDGEWYRRAFFDDGSPLGSSANAECRIDLIAQSWAVLSSATPDALARRAMASVDRLLVDADAGLVRLLDPPLAEAEPSAGYIQAYPPGVRENGGQYSHAGVWAVMAQAALGDGNAAYRYFTYLSPAHRSRRPDRAEAYRIEPYVMAGDVYSAPPYVGRGGWSWYTGSAAWMHRAAIESMFGVVQRGDELVVRPCLPSLWTQAELRLTRGGKTVRLLFIRAEVGSAQVSAAAAIARHVPVGETLRWSGLDGSVPILFVLPPASDLPRAAAAELANAG